MSENDMSSTEEELSRPKFCKLAVFKRDKQNYTRGACAVLDFEFIGNFKFNKKRSQASISRFVYLNSDGFETLIKIAATLLEDGRELIVQSKTKWKRDVALNCLQRYAERHKKLLHIRRR